MQPIDEVRKELKDLEIKMKKIYKIMLSNEFEQTNEKEKELLYKQIGFMEAYENILKSRIHYRNCIQEAKEITDSLMERIKEEIEEKKERTNKRS